MTKKILLGTAALVVVGVLGWVVSARSSGEARWAAFEKRSETLVSELKARSPRRPVLRGAATPGNAWTEYLAASGPLNTGGLKPVQDWLEGKPESDARKAAEALEGVLPALDLIRVGASREEAAYPYAWEKGLEADTPSLREASNLVLAANGQARRLREAGKLREAADVLLDAAQFAGDQGRRLPLICQSLSRAVLMKVFEGLRALPPDPEIARALAVLDGSLPGWDQALLDDVAILSAALRKPETLDGMGQVIVSWRYGFSTKLMVADAWDALSGAVARLSAAARAPYAEALREGQAVQADGLKVSNPLAREWIGMHGTTHLGGHTLRAQLRLLRRYHGETAPLGDPFGDKIRSDAAKAWSLGADGVDDGGKGAWTPAPQGDLVIELRR